MKLSYIFKLQSILFCLCFCSFLYGQNASTKVDLLKHSLDTLDRKEHGKVLFNIARLYLEKTPNTDSFLVYMDRVKAHADKFEDDDLMFNYHYYMGTRLYRISEYDKAEQHINKASELSRYANDSSKVAQMFYANAVIQRQLKNDEGFQENLLKALAYAEAIPNRTIEVATLIALAIESGRKGLIDQQKTQLDRAILYIDKVSNRTKLNLLTELGYVNLRLFERDSIVANFNDAKKYINRGIALADSVGNRWNLANLRVKELFIEDVSKASPERFYTLGDSLALMGIELDDPYFKFKGSLAKADALLKMDKPMAVLGLKSILLENVEKLDDPIYYRDLYEILYQAASKIGQYKAAVNYNDQYLKYNDSILSLEKSKAYTEVLEKYESEKKAKEILELTQDKKNLEMQAMLKDSHLKQQYLIFGLVLTLLSLLGWIIYNIQQKRMAKVNMTNAINEQKLLRSQMNPHFLFNSLNSIKRFYVDGRVEEADDFLSDFSSLLRKILDQSSKISVPIEEELEFLRLYLELEKRRLNKKLNFQINFNPEEFDYDDNIPSLILQPLVENSIWHGILKSEKDGEIIISVTKEDHRIRCVVQDNGIGYHAVSTSKSQKYVSRGLNLIRERIKERGHLKIEQIYDKNGASMGTKAELILT